MRPLILLIYNLLLPPALLVALPSALRKARKRGNSKKNFLQRLSFYSKETQSHFATSTDIWIHAVSVGEVLIARRLVSALLVESPGTKIALSTTTPTGYAIARDQLPKNIPVIYSPLDLPGVVHRALSLIRPRQVVLIEAEIWPNFLTAAHAAGIPVSLVNARLSPRSARRFTKFRCFVKPIYGLLHFVGVQESDDSAIWEQLGIPKSRIEVTGSLKFDPDGSANTGASEEIRKRLESIWKIPAIKILAASTHPGEEVFIAKAVRGLVKMHPHLRLLICPRHVERTPGLTEELRAEGFSVQIRSQSTIQSDPELFIIDTTGELNAWTQLADVVIIGKSFLATGGQNPAEALAAGKPTIIGPHMENFAALVAQLENAQGILRATDLDNLKDIITKALQEGSTTAARGHEVLESHRGACTLTARRLLETDVSRSGE